MTLSHKTALVAYVPSPHRGYVNLFRKYAESVLYILGRDLIADFQPLVRNLPANDPEDVRKMVHSLGIFPDVRILNRNTIEEVRGADRIIFPEEDVSFALAEMYFADENIELDGSWRLRWDKDAALQKFVPQDQRIITREEFHRDCLRRAYDVAEKSSDWWRQIGALLVRDGQILFTAHNKHVPSEHTPYLFGDPRSNFERGEHIDKSSACHAEAMLVAQAAAEEGISTKGCDLYVTTFPCPPCAYTLSYTKIKRLFYAEGYSLVEGANALQTRGVEIIQVDMTSDPS